MELRVEGLTFRYPRSEHGKESFRLAPLSFSQFKGSRLGVLGPSGSGKSTLLRLLGGHLRADGGTIEVQGKDVTSVPPARRGIVTVFQEYGLFPEMRVKDQLEFGSHDSRQGPLNISNIVERFQLGSRLDYLPHQLSTGEKQRVAIGRAILSDPNVLLLDEPTSSIDSMHRESLLRMLRSEVTAAPNLVVIIVSHDRDLLFELCNDLIVLDHGLVLAEGQTLELRRTPPSRRAAALLGTHFELPGVVTSSGVFFIQGDPNYPIAFDGIPISARNGEKPADSRGWALVRRTAVSVRPSGSIDSCEAATNLLGTVTRITDLTTHANVTVAIQQDLQIDIPVTGSNTLDIGTLVSVTIPKLAVHVVPD